jgi:biopolymer transport protein ExbD
MQTVETKLARPLRRGPLISLVPLVDVLLILLVFFMVTSTYLDLNIIRLSGATANSLAASPNPAPSVIVSLDRRGLVRLRGKELMPDELANAFHDLAGIEPRPRIILLPSPRASVQSVIAVIESAVVAGLPGVELVEPRAE